MRQDTIGIPQMPGLDDALAHPDDGTHQVELVPGRAPPLRTLPGLQGRPPRRG